MSNSLYTPQKVFVRLAQFLPAGSPTYLDTFRFSVQGDTAGVGAQRAAHLSIYSPRSVALQKVAEWPEDAWDPGNRTLGASYGIVWLSLADLHHNASPTDTAPVVAVALVDDVLVLNVTLSATKRHFTRFDGEDENAYLVLVLAVLNHYPTLREIRWADDVTRAAREDFGWAATKQKCKDRDVLMTLGGRSYDLKDTGAEMALKALGMTGSTDDAERRKKLTGKRLMKYANGGAAIAEDQMPHGWLHQRDRHGRAVKEDGRGLIPVGDVTALQSLPVIYELAADGASWASIGVHLASLEADGKITRRSHSVVGRTYADTKGHGAAATESAKSVFVRSSFRPPMAPSSASIAEYENGAGPNEVFDADTRLFIAKVELIRTGRYFRRLNNDIRGRNVVLNGIAATYADENDEYGWFDVLSSPWAWPVDPASGEPVPSFGIPDGTCRKAAARILRELREMPLVDQGGRAHQRLERRIIQKVDNWFVQPGQPGAVYADEPTEFGIEARQNASGRENFIVLRRRASEGAALRGAGRRAWSWVGSGESRPDHIAATGSLKELAASVRSALADAVDNLIDQTDLVVHDAREDRVASAGRRAAALAAVDRLEAHASQSRTEAANLRTMAGRRFAAGDGRSADAYDALAARSDEEAERAERDASAKRDELAAIARSDNAEPRDDRVNLTVGAYLVAGLHRAVANGGRGPAPLGLLADRVLRDWRFVVDGDDLNWSADAALPLTDGELLLPLRGVIRNVRTKVGRQAASKDHVARLLLAEGRDADEAADVLDCDRRTLVVKGVMPWLVAHGITARGAKNALVDHPISAVQRSIYADATATDATVRWPDAISKLLRTTYTRPDLDWGDAACPDDVRPVMRLAATLGSLGAGGTVGVDEAALLVGLSYRAVRQWARPYDRVAGFTRPRFFEFVPGSDASRIRLVRCPHRRCRGTASHVVLLPEVAASGFAVICTTCRRAPSLEAPWPSIAYPAPYLTHYTRAPEGDGPLRVTRQTVPIDGPLAYDIRGDES